MMQLAAMAQTSAESAREQAMFVAPGCGFDTETSAATGSDSEWHTPRRMRNSKAAAAWEKVTTAFRGVIEEGWTAKPAAQAVVEAAQEEIAAGGEMYKDFSAPKWRDVAAVWGDIAAKMTKFEEELKNAPNASAPAASDSSGPQSKYQDFLKSSEESTPAVTSRISSILEMQRKTLRDNPSIYTTSKPPSQPPIPAFFGFWLTSSVPGGQTSMLFSQRNKVQTFRALGIRVVMLMGFFFGCGASFAMTSNWNSDPTS
eukprot:gnl/MRDRNA2_/MRDRNA2_83272_c0_seq2.p1 gnl/MRDRNA2_/MRDRNA2_83272_c0~~gnl/MRDRNA2_/MRDRNA2_83272_c0_seq2.p1  ORF type:complete len:257 (+),score=64.33 gnl/MRDRNA2_/MRDRNA2_83272_c0_seq2:198-968(+)